LPDGDGERLATLYKDAALTAYAIGDNPADPDVDPLDLAVELKREGVDAAPVLLTTITGHYTFAPGAPPIDDRSVQAPASPQRLTGQPTATVGVVDTGYTEPKGDLHSWLAQRVAPVDPVLDADPVSNPADIKKSLIAGHGKFVASIIAQEAPTVDVVVAGMSDLGPDPFYGELPTIADKGFTSDEIRLYIAVSRLLDAKDESGRAIRFAALNLSLGSYICPELAEAASRAQVGFGTGSGFAIEAAVKLWTARSGTPVVAAAGNHGPGVAQPGPFIPAAFAATAGSNVIPVASADCAGVLSDFSNDLPASAVGVKAPGENLIGVRMDDRWSAWSGSSFATAVVSASLASTGAVPPPGILCPLVAVEQLP
jgi:hypothetical protein